MSLRDEGAPGCGTLPAMTTPDADDAGALDADDAGALDADGAGAPDATDPDRYEDDEDYGPSPGVVLRRELSARPALLAVAVELLFVLVLGNQWVFDHVVTPWSLSTSAVRRGLAGAVGWFSWLFVPQHGLFWVWLAGVLHVLVWLVLTYRLARPGLRSPDVVARFVSVMGAVMVAAVAALVVSRVVTYADIHKLYAGGADVGISPPGFIEWAFLDAVGGGAVLAVTVVAVLAASVVTAAAPAEAEGLEEPDAA